MFCYLMIFDVQERLETVACREVLKILTYIDIFILADKRRTISQSMMRASSHAAAFSHALMTAL